MNAKLLDAVADALLPGDDGVPPLPAATAVGVGAALSAELERTRGLVRVLGEAVRGLGGAHAFARASLPDRVAALAAAERAMPAEFRALVVLALEAYYQSDAVLAAMGWRVEPPQPQGHALPPFDDALLEPVKRRGRIWRDARPRP